MVERGRFADEVAGGASRWAAVEQLAEMCVPSTVSLADDVQEPSSQRLRARIERGEQGAETTAVEREHRREVDCTYARGVLAAREQRQLPEDVAGPHLGELDLALAGPAGRDREAPRLNEVQRAAGFSLTPEQLVRGQFDPQQLPRERGHKVGREVGKQRRRGERRGWLRFRDHAAPSSRCRRLATRPRGSIPAPRARSTCRP